jgi:hypothetical protein
VGRAGLPVFLFFFFFLAPGILTVFISEPRGNCFLAPLDLIFFAWQAQGNGLITCVGVSKTAVIAEMGWPWVYFCEFLQFSAEILQKPTFGAGLVRIPSAAEIILRATASVFAGRSLRSAPAGIRGVERVGEAEGP